MKWGVSSLFFFAIDPLDKLSCRRKLKLKGFCNSHSVWKLSEKSHICEQSELHLIRIFEDQKRIHKVLKKSPPRVLRGWIPGEIPISLKGTLLIFLLHNPQSFWWYLACCCDHLSIFLRSKVFMTCAWNPVFVFPSHKRQVEVKSKKNRVHLQISQSRHLFTFSIYGHRYWKCLMSFCLHFSPIAH